MYIYCMYCIVYTPLSDYIYPLSTSLREYWHSSLLQLPLPNPPLDTHISPWPLRIARKARAKQLGVDISFFTDVLSLYFLYQISIFDLKCFSFTKKYVEYKYSFYKLLYKVSWVYVLRVQGVCKTKWVCEGGGGTLGVYVAFLQHIFSIILNLCLNEWVYNFR